MCAFFLQACSNFFVSIGINDATFVHFKNGLAKISAKYQQNITRFSQPVEIYIPLSVNLLGHLPCSSVIIDSSIYLFIYLFIKLVTSECCCYYETAVFPESHARNGARWKLNITIAAGNCKGLSGPPSLSFVPLSITLQELQTRSRSPRSFAARLCNSKKNKK